MLRFSIRYPTIVSVAILIVTLFGAIAAFRLPVQMTPDVDVRTVSVITRWAGATPQDIEKEIIVEQEDYLRNIPNLDRMISSASMGRAEIELEFPLGTDISEALILVNNALSQVPSYPENVDEPRIVNASLSGNSFMFFRVMALPGNPNGVELINMTDFVTDRVGAQLERITGVAQVDVRGGAERQIRISVDPVRLAQRGISIAELRQAIRSRNRDMSGGDLASGKRSYMIRTIGRFSDLQEIENLIIARRDNSVVRLRDIGFVELGNAEIRSYARANNEPNLMLSIRRQLGTNVIDIRDQVVVRVAELNERVLGPAGLELVLTSEDVKYVESAISQVRLNLILGAMLATLVLFLFMRSGSATLIGAIGIPICTICAFLGLAITGRTINVISLAGIAFAIGMTLDNSIVVLENIYRKLSDGKNRFDAALDGVQEVWPAILASTLTTVCVFLPIVFVETEAGQLYSDIALAISASIIMSMIVAVTVVPAASRRFLVAPKHSVGPAYYRAGQRLGSKIMAFEAWLMAGTNRRLVTVAVVVAISATIMLFLTPKAEYLPEGEEKKVFASLFAPPGSNIAEAQQKMLETGALLVPHVGADPDDYDDEQAPIPALDFVLQFVTPTRIRTIAEVSSDSQVDDFVRILSEHFDEMPGVIGFVSRGSIFSGNSGGSRSINLDIVGTNLPELYTTAFSAFSKAREIFDSPQVRPDPPSLSMGQTMLEIKPDWERASELGFAAQDLGYLVWAFSDGAFVDEFFLGDDKIDMFLYSVGGTVEQPGDLEHLLIYSPEGGVVPLSAVATVEESVNTDIVRRVDGERTITLSIIPPRSVPLEMGVQRVRDELIQAMRDSGELGPGVTMQVSGASDQLAANREALSSNFLIAVLIAYLLMTAILRHWGLPLVILTTVPIGISGGILGLWLLNLSAGIASSLGFNAIQQPFDMITMMGFLVLIGTVVNNPILIVEQSRMNRRNGMTSATAVVEAVRARIRPIVMSTITTVFGLCPLVLLPGAGTELYRGLGAIVLFGLLFSAVVTLTFLPALVSLVFEFVDRLGHRSERQGVAPTS